MHASISNELLSGVLVEPVVLTSKFDPKLEEIIQYVVNIGTDTGIVEYNDAISQIPS